VTENYAPAKTQRDKLHRALLNAPLAKVHPGGAGHWLSLREIIQLGIAQYSARIAELRRELRASGWTIENYREWNDIEQRSHSWYRLAPLRRLVTK